MSIKSMVRVCQTSHGKRLRGTQALETCLEVLRGRLWGIQDNDPFLSRTHAYTPQ